MTHPADMSRRALLTGASSGAHHISSAVVVVLPARAADVQRLLEEMPGVEIHASEGNKIVITIEGPSSGSLGLTLTQIGLFDGVVAANMVFECVEQSEDAP